MLIYLEMNFDDGSIEQTSVMFAETDVITVIAALKGDN